MRTERISKQTSLKCLDCGNEFEGLASHKAHYVEEGQGPAKTVFDRAEVPCPKCGSRRVEAGEA